MRTALQFIGGRDEAREIAVNAARTVNLIPTVEKPGAKTPLTLYSTPGLVLAATAGVGPHRSPMVEFAGSLYTVSRSELVALDANLAATSVGALVTSSGRVSMVAGRDYLLLVDGVTGYTWDGTTFAVIADADFPDGATHCAYLDGYFIVNTGTGDAWNISANEDPTAWDALEFDTAASDPDDVLAVISTRRDLYAVGSKSTEVYYNSGNADFPFAKYPNGTLEWGVEAPFSVARIESVLCMLARSREGGKVVVLFAGFDARVISDDGLHWTINQMAVTDDATGFGYRQAGQTFYVLTFPSAARTFVYHVETGLWHERETWGIGRWRASGHGYFRGQHYVSDYLTGGVYRLDFATYTDAGDPIERKRVTQFLHSGSRRRVGVPRIEVEFAAGVGLLSGQGSDPQAMLRYSVDGGKTWSSEMWRPIGKRGEYERRSVWHKLGVGRQFLFEVVVTDPVPVTIIAGHADVDVLEA